MSPEFMNNIATVAGVVVAALGAFIFAFWVAMGIWAFNDIRSRSRDWLAIVLAVLLVIAFPIVGLILYMLIRPKSTLAEVYDRALEEEALLRELEESHACHSCGVPVEGNWVYCPNCHTQLQHSCPNCSNLVRNEWAICVFCGAPQRAGQSARSANDLRAANELPSGVYTPGSLTVAPALAASGSAAATGSSAVTATGAPVRRASRTNPFAPPSGATGSTGATSPASQPDYSAAPSSYGPGQPSYGPPAYGPAQPTPAPDLDDSLYRPTPDAAG
jgi:RNA polymerase subunit RPABC4/transcription elongation factor Spt4